ncbi:hypothetical protein [Kluyvera ascorbata]
MDLGDERVSVIVNAMGGVTMDLSLSDQPVTQEAISEKLEQYRRETGNAIGKGVNRDAAEIVREGSKAVR